jgi:hypothetical protein
MHLSPQTAKRVVQEKFHDPPRREELRDGRDLVGGELSSLKGCPAISRLQPRLVDRLVDLPERVVLEQQRGKIRFARDSIQPGIN